MTARTWRGWVRAEQAAAYVEYITRTGLSACKKTPGNLEMRSPGRDECDSAVAGQRAVGFGGAGKRRRRAR
jgi:hypothetical protein